MKARQFFLWVILLLITTASRGQFVVSDYPSEAQDFFALQMSADPLATEIQEHNQSVNAFIESLQRRHKNSSLETLVNDLFYRGHQKYLKKYVKYGSFNNLITTGEYDCLTGTIFYAYALTQLQIPHDIIEMPYHIYIMIDINGTHVLLESTDPLNGFVSGSDNIKERLSSAYPADVFTGHVTFEETVGLQHYNAAIKALNDRNFDLAIVNVEKAVRYYTGSRMITIGSVLSRVISASDLDNETKFYYLLRLNSALAHDDIQVASLN